MKSIVLIYYANDGNAAKVIAAKIRSEGKSAQIRQVMAYSGESEPCDSVVIVRDVNGFDRARIEAAYGSKVQRNKSQETPIADAPRSKLTLPPPPAVPSKHR